MPYFAYEFCNKILNMKIFKRIRKMDIYAVLEKCLINWRITLEADSQYSIFEWMIAFIGINFK